MDSSKKQTNRSPQASANCLSQLFFCWLFPFFKYGYQNNLKTSDLYDLLESDKCESYLGKMQRFWENQLEYKKEKTPSLKLAIFKTFGKYYCYIGIILIFQIIILKGFQPILLAEYIKYFDTSQKYVTLGEHSGVILGSINVLVVFVYALITHHYLVYAQKLGMRIRVALSSLIYRKVLKLNRTSLNKSPAGKLVNLLSNDLQRIDFCCQYSHFIWLMPFQLFISIYLLYENLGISAFAGILILMFEGVLIQGYLSKYQGDLRLKIAEKTDFRVKLMNEIVSGIKIIKMYAWEKYFAKVVEQSRNEEIAMVTKTSKIKGLTLSFALILEKFGLFCSIIILILLGEKLNADRVFSSAQIFNNIQSFVCFTFPLALSSSVETFVSIGRIKKFLLLEENERFVDDETECKKGSVLVEKVSGSWHGSNRETISDINLEIIPGQLCCVVGSVGSGKTSLLQILLREIELTHGKVKIGGNISYASQDPWLFGSSVRNNILFGQPYDKEKYKQVIDVCALETDLKQFPFGDKSIVEERGVSLSGGQRTRINLARAVYANADIYLLDDPLSAVDTGVGKHLFQKCILGYLKGKTRILVTHQLQYMKEADLIVIIENGTITKMGKFNEISDISLNTLQLKAETEQTQHLQVVERELQQKRESIAVSDIGPEETEEEIGTGSIPFSTYRKYFGYGTGLCGFIFMVLISISAQVFYNLGDLWLTKWVNEESDHQNTNSQEDDVVYDIISMDETQNNRTIFNYTIFEAGLKQEKEESKYQRDLNMIVYSILIVLILILTPLRCINFMRIVMNSSKKLHNDMFDNILQAPMKFFDTNPSGRILSRFSNDMGIIDEFLPRSFIDVIQMFLIFCGILIVIFVKIPYMIAPTLILAFIFYFLRMMYLKVGQDLKRLEAMNRAPIYSHLIATLDGITTIRSANAEEMIIKEFDNLLDKHSTAWYLYLTTNELFGFILDSLSTIFIALIIYQFLIFESYPGITGSVGLTLSQSLVLTGMLQFGVRQSTEVATNMTSVERVLQYTNLDKETDGEENRKLSVKDLVKCLKPVYSNWPEYGEIKFKNVWLKYSSENEHVLKELNLIIKPGQKVGVVGRTGAGKSSLLAVLFRLSEFEGSIIIDGVDTSKIKLSELRSKISIIPQEPVLFSATVRYNLDPFGNVPDEEIWKALESVELKDSIPTLDAEIKEGGSNFSTGQRQLLCLARAIIRNNKIFVLDEATANVDPTTDILIQKTIRKNFKNCTVISIAHRLNTIMDSDRVLVMDSGKVAEFAHPHLLLKNPKGYFSKMLSQTDPDVEKSLRKIAEEHYCHLYFDPIKP